MNVWQNSGLLWEIIWSQQIPHPLFRKALALIYNIYTRGTKYIGIYSFCIFCNCVFLLVCLSENFFSVKDF